MVWVATPIATQCIEQQPPDLVRLITERSPNQAPLGVDEVLEMFSSLYVEVRVQTPWKGAPWCARKAQEPCRKSYRGTQTTFLAALNTAQIRPVTRSRWLLARNRTGLM